MVTVLNPKQLANKDLKWEGSTTANLGIDVGLFQNRLNLTADFFLKNTKDLLLEQKLAYVTGFNSQWQNIGKIENKGIELNINSTNIQTRNFLWQTDFNISFIKNTLKALQDGTSYIQSATKFNSNFNGNDYISIVGSSLGQMYGYVFDGVYQTSDFNMLPNGTMQLKPGVADISKHAGKTAVPGMVKYKDIDGDGIITPDDRTTIGNGQPDWYGGITNTFNYKILILVSCSSSSMAMTFIMRHVCLIHNRKTNAVTNWLKLPTGGLRQTLLIACLLRKGM